MLIKPSRILASSLQLRGRIQESVVLQKAVVHDLSGSEKNATRKAEGSVDFNSDHARMFGLG